jgi:hypothetical protein
MKNSAIVIAAGRKSKEVFACLGAKLTKELNFDVAVRGVEGEGHSIINIDKIADYSMDVYHCRFEIMSLRKASLTFICRKGWFFIYWRVGRFYPLTSSIL